MDVAKLNQEILGVDLEYKNVYIDAENTYDWEWKCSSVYT